MKTRIDHTSSKSFGEGRAAVKGDLSREQIKRDSDRVTANQTTPPPIPWKPWSESKK